MHYKNIRLSDQKTANDCYDAITLIESDFSNYGVTFEHWWRCRDTTDKLLKGAQEKINALDKRADKILIKNGVEL